MNHAVKFVDVEIWRAGFSARALKTSLPEWWITSRLTTASGSALTRFRALLPTPRSESLSLCLRPTEYSFKYVNGHPSNPARGFQTVTAFGVLADVDNGYPTFEAEMTLLTALRTAATSAMVAKHLARKDSKRMAMVGAGSQSEFQALGFRGVMGIEDITIYDIDPEAVEKFKRNLEPLGFNITACSSVDEAVLGQTSSPPVPQTRLRTRFWLSATSPQASTSMPLAVTARARPSWRAPSWTSPRSS